MTEHDLGVEVRVRLAVNGASTVGRLECSVGASSLRLPSMWATGD